jgi:hypothetical protein
MMDAVIERCAGIDVGKKFILVCTLCGPSNEAPQIEIRTYGTPHTRSKLWSHGCMSWAVDTW